MKSFYIILAATLFLTASCKENNDSPPEKLEGTWTIKKMLSDPGNGSGRYTDVPDNPYVTFNTQGSASSNYIYFGFSMLDSYDVIDSTRVNLSFKEHSSLPQTTYSYKFSGDTLILNPPCIEGCGLKLIRSN